MPIVERYGPRKVDLAPLPGVRKQAHETALSEGAGVAEAEAQRSEAMARFGVAGGQAAMQLYQQERDRSDELAVLNADRQLADFENARLHDPQQGAYHTVKGKDALGLAQTVGNEYDKLASTIETRLNPRQRAAFLRHSYQRRASIMRGLNVYAGEQYDQFETAESEAAIGTNIRNAIGNVAIDPPRVIEQLQRIDQTVQQYADHKHVGPEVRNAMLTKARTELHSGVIDHLLARGQDQDATFYYDRFKEQIGGDKQGELEHRLETGSTASTGLRAATAIWQQHGPKSDADPIALDAMEEAARAQFGDNTKAVESTIRFLRERKTGLDAARQDRKEAIAGTLWRAVAEGAPLDRIRRMDAYLAAPGPLQAQISQHVVQQAEHRADRSYMLGQREQTQRQAAQEVQSWARYWEVSSPATVAAMSEHQIMGLLPEVGIDRVNDLMKAKRASERPEHVQEAKIDADLFNSVAESAGLHPYKPSQTESEKATLGQLRNAVETAIDQEQQKKKTALSRDEKQKVMQSVVDPHVMLNRWWSDPSRPAATVINAQDRDAAYVPLANIPQSSLSEWVNVIRSQFPSAQRLSRDEIVSQWRARIQRAHAATVLHLGTDEETRRLQGR